MTIVLVEVGVAMATVAALHRPIFGYLWRREARRQGRLLIGLDVIRAEHAAQVLDDAMRDPELDRVVTVAERLIADDLSARWGWRYPFIRRHLLSFYGSEILAAVTRPGSRLASPYRSYGATRILMAAVVRLAERR